MRYRPSRERTVMSSSTIRSFSKLASPPTNFAHRPARDTNPVSTPPIFGYGYFNGALAEKSESPSTGNPR